MIDIHSHLLPNVDDGSKSMTETLSLLNDAEKDGITEIILTPHFMKNGEFRIKAPELIEKFNILKNTYQGSIKLNLGNELYIHPDLPELLERNEVLSLSETDYILVEFPFVNYEEEYDEIQIDRSGLCGRRNQRGHGQPELCRGRTGRAGEPAQDGGESEEAVSVEVQRHQAAQLRFPLLFSPGLRRRGYLFNFK